MCVPSGCKYGKYQTEYDTFAHKQFDNGGATASGSCDNSNPPNDVTQWRVSQDRVYEDGVLRYSVGPFGWHTNCAVQVFDWTATVPREGSTMHARAHYEWQTQCCGGFDDYVWSNYY